MKAIVMAILAVCVSAAVSGQKRSDRKAAFNSNYNYEIQVTGVGVDGTKIYKVWGYGKKVDAAILNAKQSAVAAAIFKDIPGTAGVEGSPAICQESDAAAKHADYFDRFFAWDGPWQSYVNLTSTPSGKNQLKVKGGYKVGVVVQVLYDNLRKELERAGVAKALDSLF